MSHKIVNELRHKLYDKYGIIKGMYRKHYIAIMVEIMVNHPELEPTVMKQIERKKRAKKWL